MTYGLALWVLEVAAAGAVEARIGCGGEPFPKVQVEVLVVRACRLLLLSLLPDLSHLVLEECFLLHLMGRKGR